MPSDVQSPRPVRSLKRCLEEIDTDCLLVSKNPRLSLLPSLLPSPTPSIHNHLSQVRHPSGYPKRVWSQSESTASHERGSEQLDLDYAPVSRHCRLHSPNSTTVQNWLSGLPHSSNYSDPHLNIRASSAPPQFSSREQFEAPKNHPQQLTLLADIRRMLQQGGQRPASVASSQSGRLSTSSPQYRSLIRRNNVVLDLSGRRISQEIKDVLDTHILKGRDSPPLTSDEIFEVVDTAIDLMEYGETRASHLLGTKAFPLKHHDIAEGCNIQWTTEPLPSNPSYPQRLSAPKPDFHYGYPLSYKSKWTDEEIAVVDHRTAQPYTQPTRENLFPFLMFEFKSEATGGVLYVAENQAVGSGVHSVESLRWLLSEAFPSKAPAAADAVAFTVAISPRTAVFYIVWYSEADHCHIMSKFQSVSFMEGPDRPDIQRCRNITKSVLDFGVEIRQPEIRKALAEFKTIPLHWKKSRPASAVAETPAVSFYADGSSSNKSRRK